MSDFYRAARAIAALDGRSTRGRKSPSFSSTRPRRASGREPVGRTAHTKGDEKPTASAPKTGKLSMRMSQPASECERGGGDERRKVRIARRRRRSPPSLAAVACRRRSPPSLSLHTMTARPRLFARLDHTKALASRVRPHARLRRVSRRSACRSHADGRRARALASAVARLNAAATISAKLRVDARRQPLRAKCALISGSMATLLPAVARSMSRSFGARKRAREQTRAGACTDGNATHKGVRCCKMRSQFSTRERSRIARVFACSSSPRPPLPPPPTSTVVVSPTARLSLRKFAPAFFCFTFEAAATVASPAAAAAAAAIAAGCCRALARLFASLQAPAAVRIQVKREDARHAARAFFSSHSPRQWPPLCRRLLSCA